MILIPLPDIGIDTRVEDSTHTHRICADNTIYLLDNFVKFAFVLQWNLQRQI